jgi:CcmD family protein
MINKMFIVVAVLVTILLGLFVYLLVTNQKVKKLEKELKDLRESLNQ